MNHQHVPSNPAAASSFPLLPGAVTLSVLPVHSERAGDASDHHQCYWDQRQILCSVTANVCRTLKGHKGWCIPLWRPRHSIQSWAWALCGFLYLPVEHQDSPDVQLFPGYNTSDIRVRKNRVFFQFLIINNLLVEVVLVWEEMSHMKQQPCNVAQWVVWFLGIPVVFSLLQGTVRLKGNKDIQKFTVSYHSFLVF